MSQPADSAGSISENLDPLSTEPELRRLQEMEAELTEMERVQSELRVEMQKYLKTFAATK